MKPFHIILAVIAGAIVLTLIGFGIAEIAKSQTPTPHPDIDLARDGSTYQFNCQPVEPIDKMNQMCAVRTDTQEPVELGCVDHATLDVATITITVNRTPHQDGMIRCYATDSEGNVSDISANAGVADFTPPGRPIAK
jgi:hypothetical protein